LLKHVLNEPKTLGQHLRRKRVDEGLTNIQVAEILGVAYQTVERWEHNRTPIGEANRLKIIAFLGYEPRLDGASPSS
jgi:transcriptional regulator with XRE-family HTH domain